MPDASEVYEAAHGIGREKPDANAFADFETVELPDGTSVANSPLVTEG